MIRHLLRHTRKLQPKCSPTRPHHLPRRRFFFHYKTSSASATTNVIPHSLTHRSMDPRGTVLFNTVGRPSYGFDVVSLDLHSILSSSSLKEHLLTDGVSINFNGQYVDDDETLVYISERTGSSRIYLNRPGMLKPEVLPFAKGSLFHDRPVVKNTRLYFVSAHEQPDRPFKSWSAVYSSELDGNDVVRLTPYGDVDYSPAVSQSGQLIAVASYGSRPWSGDFHELKTDIVIFRESDPSKRKLVCRGGWPTWSGNSTIFFHRKADDGWWSIFRLDLPESFESSELPITPRRVTPPGVHTFTPAATHDGKLIAVATRRRDTSFRHIEIFDLQAEKFHRVTALLNPRYHHYNPFVSPGSRFLGYHRFRGESTQGESRIPYIEQVSSPIKELRMLRLDGSFPTYSPTGEFIAINHDFDAKSGLKIVKSDGSKRWNVLKGRTCFYNSWSPREKNVIYTSIGPIFQSANTTVQIARITFDPSNLNDQTEEISANVKILTREDTGNNAFPSCSPDGKFIVFRSGRSGYKNLYIVDAVNGEFDGGSIRPLTEGPWIDTMPSWSPDGKLIAFSSNRHNPENAETFSIYLIRPDGSDLCRLHLAGAEGSDEVNRERINHVCFSPDCEWLLFTANIGGVTAEPVSLPNQFQPYGELHIARLDGSGLRRLTWNSYEDGTPAWGRTEIDIRGLSLGRDGVGDKLTGEFDEPMWISCDI